MSQYSGEIMTAFFMLLMMLIFMVKLLFKQQHQQVEHHNGLPNYREILEQQQSQSRRREMGGITFIAVVSFIFFLALYLSKYHAKEATAEADLIKREEVEKNPSAYPTIGINTANLFPHRDTSTHQEALKTYAHPPIYELSFKRDTLERQLPQAVANNGGYSCQVGAYSSAEKAARALEKWSVERNIEGFIALQDLGEGKRSFKVLLGHFATLENAKAFTKKLGTGYPRPAGDLPVFRP